MTTLTVLFILLIYPLVNPECFQTNSEITEAFHINRYSVQKCFKHIKGMWLINTKDKPFLALVKWNGTSQTDHMQSGMRWIDVCSYHTKKTSFYPQVTNAFLRKDKEQIPTLAIYLIN